MKIKSLQISNILSFGYVEDIAVAEIINFDKNFNILIGQNGSGKSTVLEIINFIFRRILFVPYDRNQDLYSQKTTIDSSQKKNILAKLSDLQYYRGFRLDRNYDFEDRTQKIRIVVEIDDIDRANIQHLQDNKGRLSPIVGFYSAEQMFAEEKYRNEYQIDIELNSTDKTYGVRAEEDIGYKYLTAYNLYKEVIEIYNEENPEHQIDNLSESFALIGSYRNYSTYTPHASLGGGNTAPKQIQQIRVNEYSKSTNAAEGGEPSIFSLVRLRMAEACFDLIGTRRNQEECEEAANDLSFIKLINEKLKIINLKVEVKLIDISQWNFSFSFIDTKRNRTISDVNSLSAGQKAITHLVFEAYGRGSLKGGLVIIDEPEIHLHYQFQNEYVRVIGKLNEEQGCQYVLVTHSESLINSETIGSVIRLSLDENDYTKVNKPNIAPDQKWLVKILDNARSTHAFFGSKVLLVEGEDDRYFFRAVFEEVEKNQGRGVVQDIAVLSVEGKGGFDVWKNLFKNFGLEVFRITDLDFAYKFYPSIQARKMYTSDLVNDFLAAHSDVISRIEAEYVNNLYIFKRGYLEIYLNLHNKGLSNVIKFCNISLSEYLANPADEGAQEIKMITSAIIGENIN